MQQPLPQKHTQNRTYYYSNTICFVWFCCYQCKVLLLVDVFGFVFFFLSFYILFISSSLFSRHTQNTLLHSLSHFIWCVEIELYANITYSFVTPISEKFHIIDQHLECQIWNALLLVLLLFCFCQKKNFLFMFNVTSKIARHTQNFDWNRRKTKIHPHRFILQENAFASSTKTSKLLAILCIVCYKFHNSLW